MLRPDVAADKPLRRRFPVRAVHSSDRYRHVPAIANATTSGGLIRKFALMLWCTRASKFRLPERTLARDQIVINHNLFDRRIEWSGVADAGRATVTDQIEAKLIQVRLQPGAFKILRDDPRTRRQGILY